VQQTLPLGIQSELCPLCFAVSYPHPGNLYQCSSCATVFTTRVKPLASKDQDSYSDVIPRVKRPLDQDQPIEGLNSSERFQENRHHELP
jgi:hypothetical protein